MTKRISIVIPVYNEVENIPHLFEALTGTINKIQSETLHFDVLFINDGSTDNSIGAIEALCNKDSRYKFIDFSRNFGKEMATTAGLREASGDAILIMDADLQHPVSYIPQFIEQWQRGSEVVVGLRTANAKEGIIKRWGGWLFYSVINSIGETKIIRNATDFRLLDRTVVDAFNRLSEHNRMTRGLIDWMGFKRSYVKFVAAPRTAGTASYTFIRLLRLAFSSFISHSFIPLKMAGYLGVIIMAISGPLGVFVFINKYLLEDPWGYGFTGPAALAVILMFFVGVILVCLGLMALYIANIHIEVTGRPLYIIRRKKI